MQINGIVKQLLPSRLPIRTFNSPFLQPILIGRNLGKDQTMTVDGGGGTGEKPIVTADWLTGQKVLTGYGHAMEAKSQLSR